MAQATNNYNRFHNFSHEALADALGDADLALKAHEAEVKALKDEFKNRGLLTVAGEHFTVTRSDQVSSRTRYQRREAIPGRRVASFRNDEHILICCKHGWRSI